MVDEAFDYFNDALLKEDTIHFRHYQNNIFRKCKDKNSLVVLPTGLGKTIIGILLIAYSLKKYPESKALILAPTRPLVSQHKNSCIQFLDLDHEKIVALTGRTNPERRIHLFNEAKVIISTPQVIKNDLLTERYHLKYTSLIIFDEAHRTKGKYAYNFISDEYMHTCEDPVILGLTASPGKNYFCIQELCDNLHIENIILKTYEDEDVSEYIYDIDLFLERVDLPIKILELSQVWQDLFKKFLRFFIKRELINPYKKYYSKLDFLRIAQDLTTSLRYEASTEAELEDYLEQLHYLNPKIIDLVRQKNLNIHSLFSYCSSCISLLHAKDLLETQNISLFSSFLERLSFKAEQDIASAKRITNSKHFKFIQSQISQEAGEELNHPKIRKIHSLIREEIEEFHNEKIIIFTQYRDMAEYLKLNLQKAFSNQLKVEKFIGQTSKPDDLGFSQRKQISIIEDFRKGEINILIATSVAEEGLDIPNVDAVIFYEPVPSEIRLIQRRGRTGRYSSGRCYILVTEDTVDVPFYIVANRKEDAMHSVLNSADQLELKNDIKREKIAFNSSQQSCEELEVVKNFRKRREEEKRILANRSIEEMLTELDQYSQSPEYKKLKAKGVNFITDHLNLKEERIQNIVYRLKGGRKKKMKKKNYKRSINHNEKTLVDIDKRNKQKGK